MGILTSIILGLGSVTGVIALHLAADEIGERVPSVARRLIRRAAGKLPKQQRLNYEEEWLAHLNECPGMIAKLLHAIGCVICGRNLKRFFERLPVTIEIDGEPFYLELDTGLFAMWSWGSIVNGSMDWNEQKSLANAYQKALARAQMIYPPGAKLNLNQEQFRMLAAFIRRASRNGGKRDIRVEFHCR
jgi:hypothetical protein